MPVATLLFPASYTVRSKRFVKGVPLPVEAALAAYLGRDPKKRFAIDWQGDTPPADAPEFPPPAEGELPQDTGISLLDAIDQVDVDQEDNFDEDGKPKIAVLSEMMGREITADERDRVMGAAAQPAAPAIEPADQPAGRTRIVRKHKPDPSQEGAQEV